MIESPIDVWTSQAIPAGSSRYYALLHCEQPSRSSAVITLITIWSRLCFSNREMEAAKKQIDWWQSEIHRNTPQHPVTQQLLRNIDNIEHQSQLLQQLDDVLHGYASLVTEGSPSRPEPYTLFHQRTGASAAMALTGLPTPDTQQTVQSIGIALSEFRCIRHLHKHVASGLLCLPLAALEAADLSPKLLTPGQYPEALVQFLSKRLTSIDQQLTDSLHHLPAECPNAVFLYVYARLQQKLLRYIQKEVTVLDQPDIRLSPLRNFWLARAAARQQLKQRKLVGRAES